MTVNIRSLVSRGRERVPNGLAMLALAMIGTAVACAPARPPSSPSVFPTARSTRTPPTATEAAIPTVEDIVPVAITRSPVARPRNSATALARARARATPRRVGPPRPQYTPTPEPTPLPPSEALAPTANGLLTKLTAMRTAMKGHDVATTLKAQRQ